MPATACPRLSSTSPLPGTYGSVIDTLRHTVGTDAGYLFTISNGRHAEIDEDSFDLPMLRQAMLANGPAWAELLAGDLDPGGDHRPRHRDDGSTSSAPLTIGLAQALHHETTIEARSARR